MQVGWLKHACLGSATLYGWIDAYMARSRSMVEVAGEGLPRRTYTVRVRVIGREHKPNASHARELRPMHIPDRFPSGGPIPDPMTSASVIAPYVSALSGG